MDNYVFKINFVGLLFSTEELYSIPLLTFHYCGKMHLKINL